MINATEEVYGIAAARQVNSTAVGKTANVEQLWIRSSHKDPQIPIYLRVNSLDNLRKPRPDLTYDQANTPLEFVYEAADCRLFDTIESVSSPTWAWKLAVDAKWGNGSCVESSMGDPSAISTESKVLFNKNSPLTNHAKPKAKNAIVSNQNTGLNITRL